MRLPALFAAVVGLALTSAPLQAYTQELIPVVRQVGVSQPSISTDNAFIPVLTISGCATTPVSQVAALMDGTLRWHSVTHSVDLTVRGHVAHFFENSDRASFDGRPRTLDCSTVKNDEGFWVPVSFFASESFFHHTRVKLQWPPVRQKVADGDHGTKGLGGIAVAPTSPPSPQSPQSAVAPQSPPSTQTAPAVAVPAATSPIPSLPVARGVIKRIVIDPGHGGKDPGTQGAHGIEEKALNLVIAQNLADALRSRGYEVLLTRTDDTFIPLEERTHLANRYNADLFISIHCNASLSSKLKGYEVYFLSETASDPHADAVARMENASLSLEGKSAPTHGQVQAVLRSLVKTAYINESSELGALVDRHMGEQLSEPRLGVKQAGFYVLRGAEMPAVLIETGFLSNPAEERLLQRDDFQKRLVEGIVGGVNAYDERKRKERHG